MSGRLRWLLLAQHVPADGGGGIVRYTAELAAALAVHPDVELTVVAAPAAVARLRALTGDRPRIVARPAPPGAALTVQERYAPDTALVADHDVIHGVRHVLPRRAMRARKILTVHDMLPLDRPQDFRALKRAFLPPVYRRSIASADLLLPVSDATESRLVSHMPDAVNRSVVVPLAVAANLLNAVPQPVPRLEGRPFALVVGDSTVRKNVGLLVDLWDEVRRAVPDAVLAIAGPPDWGPSARGREFDRLRQDGSLLALGHVSDAQLSWAYRHTRLTLCPSLAEGFGLPVAEGLAFGSPVAVADDPAMLETAGDRAVATLSATDSDGWRAACVRWVAQPRQDRPSGPVRGWDEVAQETVRAARAIPGPGV